MYHPRSFSNVHKTRLNFSDLEGWSLGVLGVSADGCAIHREAWVVMVMGGRGLSWKRITKMSDEIVPNGEVNMMVRKGELIIASETSLMGLHT